MDTCAKVDTRVKALRGKFADRDRRMNEVRLVRAGRLREVRDYNQYFTDDLPDEITANITDTAIRDLSEVMGVLPGLACSSGNGSSTASRQRAGKKNRIGRNIWKDSRLDQHFIQFADHFASYGVGVLAVDPDFHTLDGPRIRVEDPRDFYYLLDSLGNVTECAKTWCMARDELIAMYPEHESALMGNHQQRMSDVGSSQLEVVRYSHRDFGTILYCPSRDCLVLSRLEADVRGRLPYFVAQRYDLEAIPRGQFDNTIGIQYARVLMTSYMFRAAERSINAPIALPRDAGEFVEGADGVIYSDQWRPGHGILPLNVPREIFAYSDSLDKEAKEAGRYPDARTGGVKASIITGRGVEALLGTFDTQIKTGQLLFKRVLEEATDYAFRLEMKYWANRAKKIEGVDSGQSYSFTYIPSRDIGEDYACEVSYGFMLGNSPAQAMLLLLQLKGAGLISDNTVISKLPFDLDYETVQREKDQEGLTQALMSGLAATAQSFSIQIQQGKTPAEVLTPLVEIYKLRERGKPLHEAIAKAYIPKEEETPEGEMPMPGMEGAQAGGPGMNSGLMPSGLLRGVAPGQAGSPPGGLPDLMTLAAGLRGSKATPNISSTILTRKAMP